MAIPMQVAVGDIPAGTCPATLQAMLNLFGSKLSITFPLSAAVFNYGNSVPIPDQQSFPWIRLNADGTPDGLYVYANGAWVRPHPVPPNSPILFPYNGSLASIATYDGGEGSSTTPVTDDSGPMWAPSTTDGLPPASDGSNVVAYGRMLLGQSAAYPQGATGGEYSHTQTPNEMAQHDHPVTNASGTNFTDVRLYGGESDDATCGSQGNNSSRYKIGLAGGNPDGTTSPMNILNPYLSVYFISRTSRVYYRA